MSELSPFMAGCNILTQYVYQTESGLKFFSYDEHGSGHTLMVRGYNPLCITKEERDSLAKWGFDLRDNEAHFWVGNYADWR